MKHQEQDLIKQFQAEFDILIGQEKYKDNLSIILVAGVPNALGFQATAYTQIQDPRATLSLVALAAHKISIILKPQMEDNPPS